MNWNDLLLYVLEAVASLVITAVGGVLVPYLINRFAKGKAKDMAEKLNTLVTDACKEVYQTYVEALKGTDLWTAEAQKKACDKALAIIKNNLPAELKAWLEKNKSDIDSYIISMIETALYNLKK